MANLKVRSDRPRKNWDDLPQSEVQKLRRIMRRSRWSNIFAYGLIVVVATVGFYQARESRIDVCQGNNEVRKVLRAIIRSGTPISQRSLNRGEITLENFRDIERGRLEAIRILQNDDCEGQ